MYVLNLRGQQCSPPAKVYKRIIDGDGDNVHFYYRVLSERILSIGIIGRSQLTGLVDLRRCAGGTAGQGRKRSRSSGGSTGQTPVGRANSRDRIRATRS
jgi:hypothetical protein